jgi:DNA processing protein
LIKQGAKLVESAQDVLEELHLVPPPAPSGDANTAPSATALDAAAQAVLTAMGYHPIDVDVLCARTGLTPAAASAMLLRLELDGFVSRLVGGMYQRVR